MHHTFWHDKWEKGEIGFHQSDINPMLKRFAEQAGMSEPCRVFVPLCGKTQDMTWLLERGCEVVGVELSKLAVEQYFESLGVTPYVEEIGKLTRYSTTDLTIYCGDLFALMPEQLGDIDAVYDRAALVALPPEMRQQYCQRIAVLAPEAKQILITFEYDQAVHAGPPFSVPAEEVQQYYAGQFSVDELLSEEVKGGLKGKVPAIEKVWFISSER